MPDALNPDASFDPSSFLNGAYCVLSEIPRCIDVQLDNDVRRAIHAPNQDWQQSISYPWGSGECYLSYHLHETEINVDVDTSGGDPSTYNGSQLLTSR